MKAKDSKPKSTRRGKNSSSQSIQLQRDLLDMAMASILKKDCRQSLSLWVSLAAMLKKYNLQRMYDPKFVLNESYIRGVRSIEDGTTITSHIAWLRQTSYNVVKELSRQRQKRRKETGITGETPEEVDEGEESEAHRQLEHRRMQAAFSQLEPLEREILSLKVVKDYRWSHVREALVSQGYDEMKKTTLRQRKTRALRKLRDYYRTVNL